MRTQAIRVPVSPLAAVGIAILAVLAIFALGCGGNKVAIPPPPPTERQFRLTHHVGGTHYRVLVNEGRCIVAFSNSVQVIDPQSLQVITNVSLGPFGQCGPVTDMAIVGEQLFAVVEDDAVALLHFQPGVPPKLEEMFTSEQWGVQPRRLSVVDGTLYASGPGGVVRVPDGKRMYASPDDCGHVARAGNDLVVCVGRRVYQMADGRYVGAASDLVTLSDDGEAMLAFALQGEANALAGLMTPDVREIVGGKGTVAMPERIERIRVLGDKIFFVGSQRVDWYDIASQGLTHGGTIDILGALDVDQLDERTFILAGTSGRGIYQLEADNPTGTHGSFIAAEREASRLTLATGDGLNVFAGSREGAWMYLVNARAELTRRSIEDAPPGAQHASTVDASAVITPDGSALRVTPAPGRGPLQPWEYQELKGARLRTVIAVDGNFWVGHDRGITVLRADGGVATLDPKQVKKAKADPAIVLPRPDPVMERLRIPGPVTYLFPLLAGKGAAYVSEFGGFGVARFVDEEK